MTQTTAPPLLGTGKSLCPARRWPRRPCPGLGRRGERPLTSQRMRTTEGPGFAYRGSLNIHPVLSVHAFRSSAEIPVRHPLKTRFTGRSAHPAVHGRGFSFITTSTAETRGSPFFVINLHSPIDTARPRIGRFCMVRSSARCGHGTLARTQPLMAALEDRPGPILGLCRLESP